MKSFRSKASQQRQMIRMISILGIMGSLAGLGGIVFTTWQKPPMVHLGKPQQATQPNSRTPPNSQILETFSMAKLRPSAAKENIPPETTQTTTISYPEMDLIAIAVDADQAPCVFVRLKTSKQIERFEIGTMINDWCIQAIDTTTITLEKGKQQIQLELPRKQ